MAAVIRCKSSFGKLESFSIVNTKPQFCDVCVCIERMNKIPKHGINIFTMLIHSESHGEITKIFTFSPLFSIFHFNAYMDVESNRYQFCGKLQSLNTIRLDAKIRVRSISTHILFEYFPYKFNYTHSTFIIIKLIHASHFAYP